jgi:hypothetical protein
MITAFAVMIGLAPIAVCMPCNAIAALAGGFRVLGKARRDGDLAGSMRFPHPGSPTRMPFPAAAPWHHTLIFRGGRPPVVGSAEDGT